MYRNKLQVHQILGVAGLAIGTIMILPTVATVLDPYPGNPAYRKELLALVLANVAVLFFISSVALLRRRNWGRLLLSALLHLPIVGLVLLTALFARDFLLQGDVITIVAGGGVFLGLAVPLVAIIALLHSQKVVDELTVTKPDSLTPMRSNTDQEPLLCSSEVNVDVAGARSDNA